MAPDKYDKLLARIDAVVGPPEAETDQEHAHRREMVARDLEARRLRRAGTVVASPRPH